MAKPRQRNARTSVTASGLLKLARKVLENEATAVREAANHLNGDFPRAVRLIANCKGRLVVSGMGKANFVGQKISATFASTGTPSLFLHPADALHGDLGRLTASDLLLVLSHSGETDEILRLLGPVKTMQAKVLAMTASKESTLGQEADLTLEMGKWEEAGSGLAPTTSTTVMLALGDALAMAVWELRGFTEDHFRQFHPAGSLGRKLMRVKSVMRTGDLLPMVKKSSKLSRVIAVMTSTKGRPGAAIVTEPDGRLAGIFTDGDLRRLVESDTLRVQTPVSRVMSKIPKFVRPQDLVRDAALIMRTHNVDQLAVVDRQHRPVGLIDVQDLLRERLV